MKKLTTVLIAFVTLFYASAFTTKNDKISEKVKIEFQKDFSNATYVNWQKTEGINFATFKLNDQDFSAAYNDDAELLGASRTITTADLPLSVSLSIQNNYPDYSFDQSVTEITKEGETTYYFTAENNKYKVNLTSGSTGILHIVKKMKKK